MKATAAMRPVSEKRTPFISSPQLRTLGRIVTGHFRSSRWWETAPPTCAIEREKDKAARTAMFTGAIQNMKTLAEGGKLAPRQ
jgi:hypothetical protein